MLLIFVVAGLSFLSDIKIAMIAQALSIIGITVLGLVSPVFSVMLIFLFINSMGMHLLFPMQDSIGMSIAEPDKIGKRMGQYKGFQTGFQMVGAGFVYIGFKTGIFNLQRDIKLNFLIAAVFFGVVFILMIYLNKAMHVEGNHPQKITFVARKEYKYYYILVVMFGVQKQIMMVYGPWVLIEILNKKADTIAVLGIIGSFIGMFFIPALGRWLDRFGVKKLLYADALSFIGVYLLYGFLSAGYVSGSLLKVGVPVFLAYLVFVIDRMSGQMGIVRTVYLKSIAVKPTDITSTLSLGISLDHIVSIACAYAGGYVWVTFGPQYIFFLAAGLSLVNLYVAMRVDVE